MIKAVPLSSWWSTPARAGIIQNLCSCHTPAREHPRACGDYAGIFAEGPVLHGAPPRVRGLSSVGVADGSPMRSTPARAGIIGLFSP